MPEAKSDLSVIGQMKIMLEGEGEDEVNYFFQQFEDIAKLGKWNEEEKLILVKTRLKGAALKFAIRNVDCKKATGYEEFKKLLISNFTDDTQLATRQSEFNEISMREEEKIKEYADRVCESRVSAFGER